MYKLFDYKEGLRGIYLKKWASKFDTYFINHLSGDVALEKITIFYKEVWYIVKKGQGGHWLNKFIEVEEIIYPTGITKISELAEDIPFKAKINIKSLSGEIFPKRIESSMFPKNWSLERIQEEVAWVYENTVAKGVNVFDNTGKFDKYIFTNSDETFNIIIEVNDVKKIMNSYPKIK